MSTVLKKTLLEWRAKWVEAFYGKPMHDWVFYNPNRIRERSKGFASAFATARGKAAA